MKPGVIRFGANDQTAIKTCLETTATTAGHMWLIVAGGAVGPGFQGEREGGIGKHSQPASPDQGFKGSFPPYCDM